MESGRSLAAEQREERFAKRLAVWTLVSLFGVITLLVLFVSSYPELYGEGGLRGTIASWRATPTAARTWMFFGAVAVTLVLVIRAIIMIDAPKPPLWSTRLFAGLLCAVVLVTGFTHFFVNRDVQNRHYIKVWDLYHYYLGGKYFDELGYTGIYDATVVAIREMGFWHNENHSVRDLSDYRLRRMRDVPDDNPYVATFTPERWEEFKHDVHFMRWYAGRGQFSDMLRDHGYNASPVFNYFNQTLANRIPVTYQHMTAITLIDVLLLAIGFLAVHACFGWRAGLLFAILYCINAPNRFDSLGGAFLRYVWMAALIFAVCALKTRRHGLAGFFTALAAGLNIFPVFFAGGIAVKGMWEFVRTRRLPPEYVRYVAVGSITGICLFGLSLTVGEGLGNWRAFLDQMDQHSGRLSFARVGFVYNFVYHGEITPDGPQVPYSQKVDELEAMQPWLSGLIAFLILLVGIVCTRLDDVRATIFFGVASVFLLFSMVQYYWAFLALLVLLWPAIPRNWTDALGQLLPFLMMTIAYGALVLTGYLKFVNNTVMSFSLAVYLAFVLIVFAWRGGLLPPFKRQDVEAAEAEPSPTP